MIWRNWKLHRLKHRLIFAFLIVIIIPFSLFQLLYYWQQEKTIWKNISMQNYGHLNVVKNDFESLKFEMLRGIILFEQNRNAVSQLAGDSLLSTPEAQKSILAHMEKSFQTFKFYNHDVMIFLFDTKGAMVSLQSDSTATSFNPSDLRAECAQPDEWVYKSAAFEYLQTCSYLYDRDRKPIGTVHFILNIKVWLSSIVKHLSLKQDYFIAAADGTILTGTNSGSSFKHASLAAEIKQRAEGSYLDRSTSSVVNYTHLPSIHLYMVSQFHLKSIIGDMNMLQRNLLLSVGILMVVFILITYFISSTITRPLMVLQKKMKHVARDNLKVSVSEKDYSGEVLELCRSFNVMVSDINALVERLKKEERQRESFHYKMLLSQLNPHFLINSLNLVKWNAIDRKDTTTHEICASLGTLLETSLNSEIDLIHLRNELDLIGAYLNIQQMRYKDRFRVAYEIEHGLEHVLVPKFSMQPLVENSIIHGFARMKEGGVIRIAARSEGNQMILEVADNGQGIHTPRSRSSSLHKGGIGIANLNERLKLMFRQEAWLEMVDAQPGTIVRLRFPLLHAEPYTKEVEGHVEGTAGRG